MRENAFCMVLHEMDFSHHESPNPARVETSGEKNPSHMENHTKMHILTMLTWWHWCFILYVTDLECPSCRREVTVTRHQISDLPKNLALENIVIRYTEERSKSIRKSLSLESPLSDLLLSPILDLTQLPEFPAESSTFCELCDSKFSHTSDFLPCREQLWDKSISHDFHDLQLCAVYL